MQKSEKIQEYSKAVCDQIRWKKAHTVISEEIENHLIDQRNAYIAEGADEAVATEKAIAEMGDPITVGAQLDRTHRPKPQWGMLIFAAVLVFTGILIYVFLQMNVYGRFDLWMLEPLPYVLAGLAVMAAVYFLDFTWIGRHPYIIYILLLALTATDFIIRLAVPLGGFFIMPVILPLGFAGVVYSARNKGYRGIILCGLAFLLPALMMLLARYRSDLMLFAVSAFVILCVAISKGWFGVKKLNAYLLVLIPVAVVLLLAAAYIFQYGYRWEKIQTAFDPSLDPTGEGYLGMQVKTLLANSKLIGRGNIPATPLDLQPWSGWHAFFILTYLIFDIGWLPVILLIGALLFFIIKGFQLCIKQKSSLALFVSISVMMAFTIQAVGYVATNLGVLLFSAPSLPLILSYDSYTYIVNLALVGLMLSVFRTGYIFKDRNINAPRNYHFICFNNGKLIISLNRK